MINEYVIWAFDKVELNSFYYRIVADSAKDALEKVKSFCDFQYAQFVIYKQCSIDE